MKVLSVFLFTCSLFAQPAAAPPPSLSPAVAALPDETVIAVFDDGAKFTMGDFKKLFAALPENSQQNIMRDRKGFLEQYGLMRKLAHMAEEAKLDQASPTKESIEFNRLFILSQAKMNAEVMSADVQPEEITKYYEDNKARYKQVKVKAIYIAFTKAAASQPNSSGKKLLSEDEARAKAEKLLAEIRGGADFVKLVRENSDDAASRAKDGDFETLKPTDNIPDAIKVAVFSLKQGETSEPIEQPNGFYLLRADEVTAKSMQEVRSDIIETLRQEHFKAWLQQTHDNTKVQFPSAAFLGDSGAPKK